MTQGKAKQAVIKDTIEHMLNTCEEYRIPVERVRRYRSSLKPGSSLERLLHFAEKGGKIDLRTHVRWRTIIGRAAKGFRDKALQALGFAAKVLAAYYVVKFALDPAQALADELGVSKESVLGLFDGQVYISCALWRRGVSVDAAELLDGTIAAVGSGYWVWAYDERTKKLTKWQYHRVVEVRTRENTGAVDIRFDDGTRQGFWLEDVSGETPPPGGPPPEAP